MAIDSTRATFIVPERHAEPNLVNLGLYLRKSGWISFAPLGEASTVGSNGIPLRQWWE